MKKIERKREKGREPFVPKENNTEKDSLTLCVCVYVGLSVEIELIYYMNNNNNNNNNNTLMVWECGERQQKESAFVRSLFALYYSTMHTIWYNIIYFIW